VRLVQILVLFAALLLAANWTFNLNLFGGPGFLVSQGDFDTILSQAFLPDEYTHRRELSGSAAGDSFREFSAVYQSKGTGESSLVTGAWDSFLQTKGDFLLKGESGRRDFHWQGVWENKERLIVVHSAILKDKTVRVVYRETLRQ